MIAQGSTQIPYDEVEIARQAFNSGRTRPLQWRLNQLDGLMAMLRAEEGTLLDAMSADLGKPRFEGWATDIGVLISEFKVIRKHLERHLQPRRVAVPLFVQPAKAEIRLEPLGVVLVISPWNYPLNLALSPIAAAIGAGNSVVLKPSEMSPNTSQAMADLLPRYVDPDAIRVVTGGPETASALLAEQFDHIFFTGSGNIARLVMEAAAVHLTPVTLELGGKSPVIVDRSADLEVTARRLAHGKLINAGQTCIAPDYVLVPGQLRQELIHNLVESFGAMTNGDSQTSSDFGRIVSQPHLDRLIKLIPHDRTVIGGRFDAEDRFLEPTIVVDPDPKSSLMTEEIFGPILPVVTVDDVDEAINFVNARPKPLVLYLFADHHETIERVLHRTTSGAVSVNQTMYHAGIPALPFGGVGPSGTGRYRGLTGVDRLSNHKSVLKSPFRPDPKLSYPPYGRITRRLLRRII